MRETTVGMIDDGSIAKFIIHKQPTEDSLAEADLVMVFDSDDDLSLAYEMAVTNHNLKRDWPKPVINEIKQVKK